MAVTRISFQFPGLSQVRCLFQGRDTSDPARADIATTQGLDELQGYLADKGAHAIRLCRQVHGVDLLCDPGENSSATPADGMMTDKPGTALVIRTADCQPLLITDQAGERIMALHVGWRGNRANLPGIGVAAFCARYGLRAQDLLAVRGPSLGHAEFVDFSRDWGSDFAGFYNPRTSIMDLWRLTRSQLLAAGLEATNIYGLDICTLANASLFHSWRGGDRERQASAIWIQAAGA